MGGTVRCRCGAQVHVPEAGQYVPCPKCRTMVTLPAGGRPRGDAPRPSAGTRGIPMAPTPAAAKGEAPDEYPCPGCGAPMGPGMQQCLACGRPAQGYGALRREEGAQGPGPAAKLALLALAALLLGGAAFGILFMRRRAPAPAPPPAQEGYGEIVVKSIRRTEARTALWQVQQNIQAFQALEGRLPKSLDELAQKDLPAPPAPRGTAYDYNPQTGEVRLVPVEEAAPAPAPQ